MKNKKTKEKSPGGIFHSKGFAYLIISLSVLIIYGRTVNYSFVVDDKIVISENKNVQRGLTAITSIFYNTTFYGFIEGEADKTYRPVTLTTYALEIGIFGLRAGIHHMFNVAYYLILCLLLFYLLLNYLLAAWNKFIILALSLMFALHPIHTEVVSNIKSRDELLCFLFFIIALILLLRYISNKKPYLILLSMLAYCLSLFSKETAVTFILLFPLFIYMIFPLKPKEILLLSVPFLLPLFLFLFARHLVVNDIQQELTYINNGILAFTDNIERYGLIFYILLLYIKLLVFPYPLIWDYSYGHFEPDNTILILGAFSLVLHLVLLLYGIIAIWQKKIMAFISLFYLITISLVSNVFLFIASTMGERFLFIPSFAFCIALMLFLLKIFRVNPGKNILKPKGGVMIVILAILVIYSIQSISRTSDWKDDFTIIMSNYSETNSYRARLSYVEVLYKKTGEVKNNQELFTKIKTELAALTNDYPEDPEVWYLNGLINNTLNNKKAAILSYENALKYNPMYLNAINNLGSIYQTIGIQSMNDLQNKRSEEALQIALDYYKQALQIKPDYFLALENTAKIYHMTSQYDKAIEYYKKALLVNPGDQNLRNNYNLLMKYLKDIKSQG